MFDCIIILGPTASGKTSLAIKIAKQLNTEIVNADSMYIYKYFNIGSAKPTPEEQDNITHHLIDFLDPLDDYSVSNFRNDAKDKILKISSRNLIPIIVGGTGFYIDSLINSYTYGETEKDEALRRELQSDLDKFGNEYLYEKLKNLDEISAVKIHPNDTKRIIRAIEISMLSKSNKSSIKNNSEPILKNPLIIGLNVDRETLYERINKRVDIMIKDGLLNEVKDLVDRGYNIKNCNAMKGIGYKELFDYFQGKYSLNDAIEKIKQHTRNYAKRQITWFKRNKNIIWVNPFDENIVSKILDIYSNN